MASRSRFSGAQAASNRATTSVDRLPPYQKPSHPLNDSAQVKLGRIFSDQTTRKALQEHNTEIESKITAAAAAVNDALRSQEEYVERRRKKWERGIHVEEQEEEEQKLANLRTQVEDMTRELEENMRHAIDGEEAVQRLEDGLKWVKEQLPAAQLQSQSQAQYHAQSQFQSQSQRRRNEGYEEEEAEEEGSSPGPTAPDTERVALAGASEMLADRVQRKETEYLNFSHGARYSKNNAYIGFKKMVHDAKFGDHGPPLPHADTWFTERGSPDVGITATQNGADSDDDIVLDRANISTRCPITFLKFKEPYTSKNCPHSFEKTAVLELLRRSTLIVGGGPGQRGEKGVQCPVTGCDQTLTAKTLYADPIIIRKLQRMKQAEEQEEEDSEDEIDAQPRRQTQGSLSQGSSRSPATQKRPRSSIVLDVDEMNVDDEG
ncbi:hypothetical protein EJ04DRAFT_434199 [Polyplosphaeria fusca]|uniref:SP-RING-type domain-containing protein n=1 Tax=Polyplosphaeria fusca TaxID=682080 RepID=A0A9P4V119_9PLEO|nr:hypothetical protein EJ04DRAFT_434199 [Polyplosphaeria fusca]